jgi:hypothetical protein
VKNKALVPCAHLMVDWRERLEGLDEEQRELIEGGGLSQRFSRLPLHLSHPAIIGAFYALLVTLAIAGPIGKAYDFGTGTGGWDPTPWLRHVGLQGLTMMLALAVLAHISLLINKVTHRPPLSPPRPLLFSLPFIGFAILLVNWSSIPTPIPTLAGWFLLVIPGPVYVHMSWAPRWRLLTMLEDGRNPFGPENVEPATPTDEVELEEAVDALDALDALDADETLAVADETLAVADETLAVADETLAVADELDAADLLDVADSQDITDALDSSEVLAE